MSFEVAIIQSPSIAACEVITSVDDTEYWQHELEVDADSSCSCYSAKSYVKEVPDVWGDEREAFAISSKSNQWTCHEKWME